MKDRGPASKESTQTDFASLDVLGKTPVPTTAIEACHADGFLLNSGLRVSSGGVLLVGGEVFAWRPWEAVGGKKEKWKVKKLLNSKGQWDVPLEAWGLLDIVWPKPGPSMHPVSPETRAHLNTLGISVEVQDTRNAAAQYNLLATERGVGNVAAALVPIGWKEGRSRLFEAMSQEPLLSSERPSSERSDENANAEDALLTGERMNRDDFRQRGKYGWTFWREVGLFVWAIVATAAVIIIGVLYEHQTSKGGSGAHSCNDPSPSGKRNLIFMVSDGMGPTSLSLTRSFRQFELGLPPDDILMLDKHLIGSSRTRSSDSLVTDSAAGATAFSCGLKSYNGAIATLPDHTPCGTVLEAAKAAGYMTGLVVTTRITDATPASFAAHVNTRWEEDRIAEQEVGDYPLGRVVDLMMGGGRCHFLPNSTDGSCRVDNRDIIALAKKNGFNYISDREGFDRLQLGRAAKLPLLGLFAETDIPYEVDRRYLESTYPSLDEMARTALRALTEATQDSDKGFFLMIEGSRIDHAGHGNDPVAQVHEVLAYDRAFASVLDFLEGSNVNGVVVSTSDHETGGLATARHYGAGLTQSNLEFYESSQVRHTDTYSYAAELNQTYPEYLWYPEVLANASHSSEYLAFRLNSYLSSSSSSVKDKKRFINELLRKDFGVYDATDDEIQLLLDHSEASAFIFANIINRRAQVGWSTHGHSAVDVNIYGSTHSVPLNGNHENTEIGEFIRDYLELDLESITRKLLDKGTQFDALAASNEAVNWMGKLPGQGGHETERSDIYHGELRMHRH
ncbi:hypothetical protein FGG08_004437 [Glutinoglossum americanum]|uniref:Alkaline phosphatase n=1 Tax=Glutinoglossum americanum TaxID=1670608 RepID=A0A9P8I7I9_9PEZI|nr:hypothetical protein FGG08_004437 [Glutinoglossum americanum]